MSYANGNRRQFIPSPSYTISAIEDTPMGPDPVVRANVRMMEPFGGKRVSDPVNYSDFNTRPSQVAVPPFAFGEFFHQEDALLGRIAPAPIGATQPRGQEAPTAVWRNIRHPRVVNIGDASAESGED